jgi:anti-anti-sigma regulatory factor
MLKDFYPVHWDGVQAVVALPEHIGASNAGQVRDALLSVINRGATTLIADMTATVSCDHAGADAVVRGWQRTVSSGTELRLVVTARSVSQVLGLRGLDRQVSVYPSLDAAVAARLPASIRDITGTGGLDDFTVLARDAAAAQREHVRLLDEVITGLFHAGLTLQSSAGLPADALGQRTDAVLGELDDIIRQIRGAAFNERTRPAPAPPYAPDDDR